MPLHEILSSCMVENAPSSHATILPRFLSGAKRSSPYVKICGVTNPDDALAAIECGADALGFNLFPGSKRFLRLETARNWISDLPPEIARVAVGAQPRISHAQRLAGVGPFLCPPHPVPTWRPLHPPLSS